MKKTLLSKFNLLLIFLSVILSTHVQADFGGKNPRHSSRDYPSRRINSKHSKLRLDSRYRLNRSYPLHGNYIDRLPFHRPPIHFRNNDYFYQRGVWYRPSGSRFVIAVPPIGIIVPMLPPFYATVWARGIPYYYANDVYYTWRPSLNGYMVTEPPIEISEKEPTLIADELFIYPKKNQSKQQQADDRYSCHQWSVRQTDYDPTQAPENIAEINLNGKREDYRRAIKACLEGKDYSVR